MKLTPEDYIDPRLRRDDVQREILIRLQKAAGGRSRSEAKVQATRKNAAIATAARLGKKFPKPPKPLKYKPAEDWD